MFGPIEVIGGGSVLCAVEIGNLEEYAIFLCYYNEKDVL